MGNDAVGTRIFGQSLLKYLLGLDVQMIGRFIQNQEIGRMQKHAHQRHAGALASGKHANALVYVIPPEQETAKQIPDHGRRFPRGGSFHAFQNRFIRIQIISMRLGEKATCVWRPMVTLPELGASPPEIRRENVDFPAPFTPTMAMRSPLTISKSTFSKTETEP